jgi:hypothetical protein
MAKLKEEKLVPKSETPGGLNKPFAILRCIWRRKRQALTQALFPDWQSQGLHVHFVSPYSPELNRIEIL